MRELINKLVDVKATVNSITVILVAMAGLYSQAGSFIDTLSDKIRASVTEPTYTLVKYDLMKQMEKLQKDPEDVKRMDVVKFTEFCDGYFGKVYIQTQPPIVARDLSTACESITRLYSEGQT